MAELTETEGLGSSMGMFASPVEQAAIVLLSIGEEQAAAVLRCLERDELLALTQAMSRLSGIRVDSVRSALQHFFDDYRQQSGLHGASRGYLKRSLDLALGSDIANSVLDTIYGDAIRPKMARLQYASPKWLADFVCCEHVRMQAVFLAFLPPALASRILESLPLESRELVLLHLAHLDEIERDVLRELDDLVGRCLAAFDTQSASVEGVRQVADILNRLQNGRAGMVELLRAHDPEVVSRIELSMYDFYILSRQSEQLIARLLDEAPLEQWAVALKGAEPALREAILAAMPRRQAQGFDDLMRCTGPVPMSRILQARRQIMAVVKELADAGEIDVQLFDEATAQ